MAGKNIMYEGISYLGCISIVFTKFIVQSFVQIQFKFFPVFGAVTCAAGHDGMSMADLFLVRNVGQLTNGVTLMFVSQ